MRAQAQISRRNQEYTQLMKPTSAVTRRCVLRQTVADEEPRPRLKTNRREFLVTAGAAMLAGIGGQTVAGERASDPTRGALAAGRAVPPGLMRPTPINMAEAVIEPFWDPALSGLKEWRIAPGTAHGLR